MKRAYVNVEAVTRVQRNPQKNQEIFLRGLRDVLPFLRIYSDAALTKKIGTERLQESCLMAFDFIESGSNSRLTDNEAYALMTKALVCLVQYLQNKYNTAISLNYLLTNLYLLSHAMDQAFPFYAQAGLLKFIIQSNRANLE